MDLFTSARYMEVVRSYTRSMRYMRLLFRVTSQMYASLGATSFFTGVVLGVVLQPNVWIAIVLSFVAILISFRTQSKTMAVTREIMREQEYRHSLINEE